ncbi:hypothetical protein LWI29_026890 [Acer saccharum]|uniref:Uncharacterized protein n=1 Tax=Acer saccharum TaxID=4024 RepID=A0AA39SBE9_ACESA|nr:hypothetical protein LWI29_026890 [Acer saccharum]
MGGARSTGDEQPVYDPDDSENFFTFRVHHGGEFDERMEKYSGGSISFFNYVILDSLLDIDDIAVTLAAEEGDGSEVFGDGPQVDGVGPEVFGDGPHMDGERAERDRKGKRVQVDPESNADGGDLMESDYEQEVEDIKAETCYDPSNLWDTFTFPRIECGSGSEYEEGSENLSSLDEFEAEEDEEYNLGSSSRLGDHKTFKIKSLNDEHTCAMSFKNRFVSSKHIAEKYVGQWRENPDWNFVEMSQQVRTDVNVDVSIWQYYRARNAARGMIHGSVNEQYSKL